MKAPLFILTKSEQRVVIIIMMILLALAITRRYRQAQLSSPLPQSTPAQTASSPSPPEED